jgi:hypothetical protein
MNQSPKNRAKGEVMGRAILSIVEARRAAKDAEQYLLWLDEREAALFREPGWVKLEPPRDGGVLFVHPQREIRAARARGIL